MKFSVEFVFENNKGIVKKTYTNKYIFLYLSSIGKSKGLLTYDDLDKWFYSIIKNYESESFCSDDFSKEDQNENLVALKYCAIKHREGYSVSVNSF